MSQAKLLEDDQTENSVPPHCNNEAEYDAWYRREVEKGFRNVKEGCLISNEEMNAESDALLEKLLENRWSHNEYKMG